MFIQKVWLLSTEPDVVPNVPQEQRLHGQFQSSHLQITRVLPPRFEPFFSVSKKYQTTLLFCFSSSKLKKQKVKVFVLLWHMCSYLVVWKAWMFKIKLIEIKMRKKNVLATIKRQANLFTHFPPVKTTFFVPGDFLSVKHLLLVLVTWHFPHQSTMTLPNLLDSKRQLLSELIHSNKIRKKASVRARW